MRSIFRAVFTFALMLGVLHVAQRWWLTSMVEAVKRSAESSPYHLPDQPVGPAVRDLSQAEVDDITGIYRPSR